MLFVVFFMLSFTCSIIANPMPQSVSKASASASSSSNGGSATADSSASSSGGGSAIASSSAQAFSGTGSSGLDFSPSPNTEAPRPAAPLSGGNAPSDQLPSPPSPPSESSPPSAPLGGNSAPSGKGNAILSAHNAKREIHGAPALSWDDSIAKGAQEYAQQCIFQHSQGIGLGENLFESSGVADPESDAVGSWYNEISLYDFNRQGFRVDTGHFTQVVWESSSKLGCGIANCGQRTFIVCRYDPPGNVNGQFEQNVKQSRA